MEGRPLDEAELIERAKGGDTAAFGELIRRYGEVAHRTAYLITGTAADAEDAAQEAFVKAYVGLERFRHEAPFRPWLLAIVANEARNRRRWVRRRTALALEETDESAAGNAAPSPEAAAVADEERRELLRALNRLRAGERLAIACRYFLELSEAETAAALDLRLGTVKSRLSRALDHLRARLEAQGAWARARPPAARP